RDGFRRPVAVRVPREVDDVRRLQAAQRGGTGLRVREVDDVRPCRSEWRGGASWPAQHHHLRAAFVQQADQMAADEARGAGYREPVIAQVREGGDLLDG